MPSPFPGMDPYLETPEIWPDFHNNLAPEIQGQLNRVIQPRYVARLVPHVTYEVVEIAEIHGIRPDVAVWQPQPPSGPMAGVALAVTPATARSAIPLETPLTLNQIEIRATDTLQLITAIEILSPVNKRPSHEAHGEYLRKRRDLLRSSVHLIEIDFLRAGKRLPLEKPVPQAHYYVLLSRADHRPTVEVWAMGLTDSLPVLPIPLREPDGDVPLDLRAAFATVYDRAGFATLVDYRRPPPPPAFAPDELRWLDDLLKTHTTQ